MKLERIERRKGNLPDQLFKEEVHSEIWCTGGKEAPEPSQAKATRKKNATLSQVEPDL